MFGRRTADPAKQSYPTTSAPATGDPRSYPTRHPDDAWRHADAYEQGREELVARLWTGGSGIPFVAKAFAVGRPDGGAHTYTTWTEGIETLLPAADVVLLVEQPASPEVSPQMTRVRWDVAAEACADGCWKVMEGLHPPRVLTVAWPSQQTLDWLKARSLD